MRAHTGRTGGLLRLLLPLIGGLVGCTSVKFVQKNVYTGEVWTVYAHTLGSDSITYCPPYEGANCRDAIFIDGPPPPQPPAAYAPQPTYTAPTVTYTPLYPAPAPAPAPAPDTAPAPPPQ